MASRSIKHVQWGDVDPYVTLAFTGPAAEGAPSAAATRTAMKAGRGWREQISGRGATSMGTAAKVNLSPWFSPALPAGGHQSHVAG